MEKKAWIIFGASSEIAKSLIKLLEENNEQVFAVGRDMKLDIEKLKELELSVAMFNGKVFFKKFEDITSNDLSEMLDANFTSTVLFLQKLFQNKLNVKKVLMLGSRAGQLVGHHKYFSLYAAGKTACLGLFRSLSAEHPNTFFTYYICPSVNTEIFNRGVVDKDLLVEVKSKENTVKKTPAEIALVIKEVLESQTGNFPDLIFPN